jgi:uncharacterized protein (DUF927 family)
MQNSIDFKYTASEALKGIERVLAYYLPGGKIKGNEYSPLNPTRSDKKAGSFVINTETGLWCDFATDDRGGDIVSLIAYIKSISQGDAAKELNDFLGLEALPTTQPNQPPTKTPETKPKNDWDAILPIPDDVLNSCPKQHYKNGSPSYTWDYKNANKKLLMKIMRFDTSKEGSTVKTYLPLIYINDLSTGRKQWQWKQIPENRPLYGLDELAQNPSKHILLAEGEKAADAAKELFPFHVCMAWPMGSNGIGKVDFRPLTGRTVLLWPDNDEPGIKAMQEVAKKLKLIDVGKVRILDISIFKFKPLGTKNKPTLEPGGDWPYKADAYDALKSGWTAAHIKLAEKERRGLYIKPKKKKPKQSSNFTVNDKGVYYRPASSDDADPLPPLRLCDRLDIIARTRNKHSTAWGVLVAFKDLDGKLVEHNIPAKLFATEGGAEVVRGLLDLGLNTVPGATQRRRLIEYLQTVITDKRITLVNKLGWFDNAFLLPGEVIGEPKEPLYFLDTGGASKIEQKGTLDQWQEHISQYCIDNHRLIFAACTAFAAPLLELTGSETAGFHFYGPSSQGKTTLLRLASSIYGSPDYVKTWRSTDNALEATAASHSDCLLVLDEISQCDARIIGESIYMLGNGKGKARANDRGGSNNNTAEWRLLFLSTGEKTLSEHMTEANKTIKAGMDMRLLAIPSDAGNEQGIFNNLHHFSGGAALSSHIADKTAAYYGVPFKTFISKLLTGDLRKKLPGRIKDAKLKFAHDNLTTLASGQDSRAADKFALVGLAGELASHMGITGWPKGAANEAAKVCFEAWLEQRGGEGSLEGKQIIQQIALFFERYGESRFTRWDSEEPKVDEHVPRTDNRCGFRKTEVTLKHGRDESTETTYYVLPESFRSEICKGLNFKAVIKLLREMGAIECSTDNKSSIPYRLPGYGKKKQRCYKVTPSNLHSAHKETQTDTAA